MSSSSSTSLAKVAAAAEPHDDLPENHHAEPLLECGTSLAECEHYSNNHAVTENDESRKPRNHTNHVVAPSLTTTTTTAEEEEEHSSYSIAALRERLAADVVVDAGGDGVTRITSPLQNSSTLPLVYCDQTASNRPVQSIERYIEQVCLPLYGNTHTNTSITGSQTTAFVAEARQIVAEETNAKITGKASLDVVLFAGNGATCAVELLIDCLGLKEASSVEDRSKRPIVFIGPFEHHSNLIPWRESGCEIVMVPECRASSDVDFVALERLLQRPEYEGRMKMGTFSAASNVTGQVGDVDRIAATLHAHGALAFFDYATASSYVNIDMNPAPSEQYPSTSLVAKDAIFLSPHKMLGGVGTPGVLLVKKQLVSQVQAPRRSGGGTVFYVTHTHHRFLSNRVERYEGGTPNVVGIVRVGLTFLLKRQAEALYRDNWKQLDAASQTTTPPTIVEAEFAMHQRVARYLKQHAPNLVLLGSDNDNNSCQKLPIFSFLIRKGERFLHYNYVCAILNDVFGIQSRGGCQCAGPYSQRLLGLTAVANGTEVPSRENEQLEDALYRFKERAELLRPGYTRLSLPFKGLREAEIDYVLNALVWVSHSGWMLMCQYRVNHRTGEWRHSSRQGKPLGRDERRWLSKYSFMMDRTKVRNDMAPVSKAYDTSILQEALANADRIRAAARQDKRSIAEALKMTNPDALGEDIDVRLEELRWFVLPRETAELLTKGESSDSGPISNRIVGAVNPLRPVPNRQVAERSGDIHESPSHTTRKRKPSSDVDQDCLDSCIAADADKLSTLVLVFRDGEYSGEGTVNEISEGIQEGELSELCQVFDSEAGLWCSFQSFVSDLQAANTSPQPVGEILNSTMCTAVKAEEKKKAPRTCTSWGCAVQPKVVSESVAPRFSASTKTDAKSSSATLPAKSKKFKHEIPSPKIMRLATQAIMQWEMIKEGDRLLLGLSGGKDSLSLLHCLLEFRRKLPVRFEIEVCTIDPMTPSFDPSPLIPYVESLGLKYHYIRDDIVDRASKAGGNGNVVSSLCAYCARMKRGNLYTCARQNNCNKLVLAQHLDDCAESMMMSMMHNGFFRTMKANYPIDAGDISVIRPLVYCRESLMTEFAKARNLPVINENCPACFEEPKERARVKKLLSREETLYPNLYDNMRRSLIPLMHDDMSGILRSYTEEVVARSRKKPFKEKQGLSGNVAVVSGMPVEPAVRSGSAVTTGWSAATDEELIRELARRRAKNCTKIGAKQNDCDVGISDFTGQVCSLKGGNGSIPCSELME